MSSTTTTTFRTIFGTWSAATSTHNIDLEAQAITGTHVALDVDVPSPPPRASASTSPSRDTTDPIDQFFGVTRTARGTQNSRHDTPARPVFFADDVEEAEEGEVAPPPYADSSELPSYAAVAEPPTLAMYLFKFGFLFPLFWFAGIIVLLSPLSAPENWEPTKTEAERQELVELLRRTEQKWAKRCLWASIILAVVVAVITGIAVAEAVEGIRREEYSSSRDAAEKLGILGAYTWQRLKGRALPRKKAFVKYQLFNPQQKEVLKKWVQFLALSGRPLCKRTIAPKIQYLCGKVLSRRYLYRHPDLTLGRAIGLDTKQARCFNYQTVQHHFELLQREIDEKNIPIQNLYNFDEIGIQLGGGRTSSGELHFFDTHDKTPRYKVNSNSLELVTILESVCTDGSAPIGPAIVLLGVKMHEEWFTDDDRKYL
ncbi:hypothetical protein EUX98_g9369 [Antrodiella citrinella]|uniref:Uncharacterized protein n=1 Tax=Antrodiella citrinella TaxID=2447956 RepID=A0A4V3XF39_9APHY|nr:hypothetical protein EUX98_g9369 [Antrodiella citrinella]